jgi:hypothetical protein
MERKFKAALGLSAPAAAPADVVLDIARIHY